eukprot:366962-Pleurochrysis_carterae.AAC.1
MRNLAVLRAAADSFGEPVYVFGDDAADYFNQLAMAPEEWWKLNVVFLQDGEELLTPRRRYPTTQAARSSSSPKDA